MLYVLTCEITIAGAKFRRVNEVEIESSTKVLEDTATIKMPMTGRFTLRNETTEVALAQYFKVGDPVVIKLGYNGQLRTEFEGYLQKIMPGEMLTLECIDAVFLLRKKNLQKSFRETNLKGLLDYIVDGTGIKTSGEIPTINFEKYYLKNVTAASALQELKERYGLEFYLKGMLLKVGVTSFADQTVVKYELGTNVIENDLVWINEEDTRLKIKAVNIKKDNTKTEVEAGDADGETRTLFFYNIAPGTNLKRMAEREILKYKYTGFEGGITGFLRPVCEVGNVVRLTDSEYDRPEGDYLADKVTTTFGTNGARRKIELGIKVSNNG